MIPSLTACSMTRTRTARLFLTVDRLFCSAIQPWTARPCAGPRSGVPAREQGRDLEIGVPELVDCFVHCLDGLFEPHAASSRRSEGAEGGRSEPGGCGASSQRVRGREPGAVAVLDEVEPVPPTS